MEDRILLKILESLDKIRMNTDRLIEMGKGNKMPMAKRDSEIDELVGRKRTLGPQPGDDKFGKPRDMK